MLILHNLKSFQHLGYLFEKRRTQAGANQQGTTFSKNVYMHTSSSLTTIFKEARKQIEETVQGLINSNCRCMDVYEFRISISIADSIRKKVKLYQFRIPFKKAIKIKVL